MARQRNGPKLLTLVSTSLLWHWSEDRGASFKLPCRSSWRVVGKRGTSFDRLVSPIGHAHMVFSGYKSPGLQVFNRKLGMLLKKILD